MRQLPGTCSGQHGELDECPADNTGVGSLGLITEFSFTLLQSTKVSKSATAIPPPPKIQKVVRQSERNNIPVGTPAHDEYPVTAH